MLSNLKCAVQYNKNCQVLSKWTPMYICQVCIFVNNPICSKCSCTIHCECFWWQISEMINWMYFTHYWSLSEKEYVAQLWKCLLSITKHCFWWNRYFANIAKIFWGALFFDEDTRLLCLVFFVWLQPPAFRPLPKSFQMHFGHLCPSSVPLPNHFRCVSLIWLDMFLCTQTFAPNLLETYHYHHYQLPLSPALISVDTVNVFRNLYHSDRIALQSIRLYCCLVFTLSNDFFGQVFQVW